VSEQLEIDLLEGVVADAAAIGYRVMSVSGGEPLLYPGLAQLLRAAHASGLVTTVTTNGMLLDQRQLNVLGADCDLVAISLDGIPESHNFMRNSTRAFDDMCARLPALRASGIPFGFIFTLTFHNVHELEWVADFAVEQGASLLQLHPLEPVGRATCRLGESYPDGEENAAAVCEAGRIRELYEGKLEVQIDLATVPAMLEHPTRVFVREATLCGAQTVADVIAPLVIETSGIVSPLQYGFPRAWSWGNIKERSLPDLAADWLARDYAAFLTLCRLVYEQAVRNDDEPVLNWYEQAYAAAAQFSPTQVRENLMQTCSSERSSQ
jgi:MoaA/NifB/PqqE/SkfB family radical SAM enzyme